MSINNKDFVVTELTVRSEFQNNPVSDEVSALYAIIRPVLTGLLYALKEDVVNEVGGYENIKLKMLPRLYRAGDGDCGICYEYAVHDAIKRKEPSVVERVEDSIKKCKVPGKDLESILFGVEKKGATQLIATAQDILTDDSRLLTGKQSQPPKLKGYINMLAAAFRRPNTRLSLPTSINGLWKADLFLGTTDGDRYVGTTVKINPRQLEAANGLRVAIVPASQGKDDRIKKDEKKNLIICPLPYDGEFIETFYNAWNIVQKFIESDARMPKEVDLPMSSHRYVVKQLVQRSEFPILEVIESFRSIAQPHLLITKESNQSLIVENPNNSLVDNMISPIAKLN